MSASPSNNGGAAQSAGVVADEQAALEFLAISRGKDRARSLFARVWGFFSKLVAMVLLVPLRFLFIVLLLATILLMYRMSICLGPASSALGVHTKAQRRILRLVSPLWRLVLFFFGIVHIRTVRPKEFNSSACNATVVANHVTTIDGTLLGHLLRLQVTGVAASWVANLPLVSIISRAHKILSVQGESKKIAPDIEATGAKSATDTIVEYQQACAANPELLRCIIFPEGTTKATSCLLKFKSGAFVSGEPVQPVAIKWPDDVGWVNSLGGHILNLLTHWCMCLEVIFLPLYVPSDEESKDAKLYAQNVQDAIAKALDLPPDRNSAIWGRTELSALARDRAKS